ncbi:hypothetical protein HMPREF9452_01864 [Collinsella tanakaei YIT 12063]|uniref:Uncharacterized protein n=1 Tax=Collinsella tanakaei YIT 12063 TaxID=742742 RepID=G1WKK1_9ACTN|nr:hypothetical protein HMPREF9452_01864 [Collinsella tanakaei YIT 12063]
MGRVDVTGCADATQTKKAPEGLLEARFAALAPGVLGSPSGALGSTCIDSGR